MMIPWTSASRHHEAEVAAQAADEEAEVFTRLQARGLPAQIDVLRAKAEAQKRRAAVDTLEEMAVQLGLAAEQVMLPVDHVLLPEAQALPAVSVVRLPSGVTHFVVVWRRHGRVVQLMDPGTGRRWPPASAFSMNSTSMPCRFQRRRGARGRARRRASARGAGAWRRWGSRLGR